MKCNAALDLAWQTDEPLPLIKRIGLAFHIIVCGKCAAQIETCQSAVYLLKTNLPPSPDFSEAIMNRVYREAADEESAEENIFEQAGFSTKGWVFAGLVMLLSLATAFLGQDFVSFAGAEGASFLLPVGIIIGIVISGYGALFIGSHLKELTARFKL